MKELLAVLLLLCSAAWAQIPSGPGAPSVKLIAADTVTVTPGKSATATLLFKISDG